MGLCHTHGTPNLGKKTRSYSNKRQKKKKKKKEKLQNCRLCSTDLSQNKIERK